MSDVLDTFKDQNLLIALLKVLTVVKRKTKKKKLATLKFVSAITCSIPTA